MIFGIYLEGFWGVVPPNYVKVFASKISTDKKSFLQKITKKTQDHKQKSLD